MVEGINSVRLQGELRWPELRYTKTGKALMKAKLRIPVADRKTENVSNAYLRITAWEDFAEYIGSLEPMTRLCVSGRIQERSFQTQEGQRRAVTDIVVDGIDVVDTDESENQFILQGQICWPELKYVGGDKNTALYKSKLRIPYIKPDGTPGTSYVRITGWNETAESLAEFEEGSVIKVAGHIQERTWNAPNGQKRVFTDAVVTNFTPVEVSEHGE